MMTAARPVALNSAMGIATLFVAMGWWKPVRGVMAIVPPFANPATHVVWPPFTALQPVATLRAFKNP